MAKLRKTKAEILHMIHLRNIVLIFFLDFNNENLDFLSKFHHKLSNQHSSNNFFLLTSYISGENN